MEDLRFEWDEIKDARNLRKHGVSFEEASTVFADDDALLLDDPDHSREEDRFVLLGLSASLRILVISHVLRGGSDVIRIISARRANRHERSEYSLRKRR